MTVFQVENRDFRVHRHFLAENSPIFSSMYSLPPIPNEANEAGAMADEGAADENPIYLSGVTELEFETLLRYFYKGMHDDFSLPQSSWIALLSIAHRYEFLNVRVRAIREIYDPVKQRDEGPPSSDSPSEPPDYLMLMLTAEKYDVPLEQALPSFVGCVMREEPLTEVEIARLSTLTAHRLARAREDYLRKTKGRSRNVAKGIVRDIWPAAQNK